MRERREPAAWTDMGGVRVLVNGEAISTGYVEGVQAIAQGRGDAEERAWQGGLRWISKRGIASLSSR